MKYTYTHNFNILQIYNNLNIQNFTIKINNYGTFLIRNMLYTFIYDILYTKHYTP